VVVGRFRSCDVKYIDTVAALRGITSSSFTLSRLRVRRNKAIPPVRLTLGEEMRQGLKILLAEIFEIL
jgi:hypothetical protein